MLKFPALTDSCRDNLIRAARIFVPGKGIDSLAKLHTFVSGLDVDYSPDLPFRVRDTVLKHADVRKALRLHVKDNSGVMQYNKKLLCDPSADAHVRYAAAISLLDTADHKVDRRGMSPANASFVNRVMKKHIEKVRYRRKLRSLPFKALMFALAFMYYASEFSSMVVRNAYDVSVSRNLLHLCNAANIRDFGLPSALADPQRYPGIIWLGFNRTEDNSTEVITREYYLADAKEMGPPLINPVYPFSMDANETQHIEALNRMVWTVSEQTCYSISCKIAPFIFHQRGTFPIMVPHNETSEWGPYVKAFYDVTSVQGGIYRDRAYFDSAARSLLSFVGNMSARYWVQLLDWFRGKEIPWAQELKVAILNNVGEVARAAKESKAAILNNVGDVALAAKELVRGVPGLSEPMKALVEEFNTFFSAEGDRSAGLLMRIASNCISLLWDMTSDSNATTALLFKTPEVGAFFSAVYAFLVWIFRFVSCKGREDVKVEREDKAEALPKHIVALHFVKRVLSFPVSKPMSCLQFTFLLRYVCLLCLNEVYLWIHEQAPHSIVTHAVMPTASDVLENIRNSCRILRTLTGLYAVAFCSSWLAEMSVSEGSRISKLKEEFDRHWGERRKLKGGSFEVEQEVHQDIMFVKISEVDEYGETVVLPVMSPDSAERVMKYETFMEVVTGKFTCLQFLSNATGLLDSLVL